jgi:hypothetical protein
MDTSAELATDHETSMSAVDLGSRVRRPHPNSVVPMTPPRASPGAPPAGWFRTVWESALVIGLFLIIGGIALCLRARLALPL